METLSIPDPRHGYGTTVPEPRLYALLAVEVKPGHTRPLPLPGGEAA